MITITREWLQQTIAEFENNRDDIPFGLDDDDAKILKVLKQALASLDAKPVQETGVYKDMLNIIGLLENNEWAEHCTSTVLGSLLESEITRLVGKEQLMSVVPETLPCPVHLVPGLRLGKGCKTETLLIALQRRAEYYAGLDAMTPEERAKHYANIEAFKAMLPQPAPVAPEDLRRSFEAVARLNNEMYRWTSCMSYNGSYVGEPEGLLKRNIREIERILDRCKSDKGE